MSAGLELPDPKKRKRNEPWPHRSSSLTKPIVLQEVTNDCGSLKEIELQPKLLIPRDILPFAYTQLDRDHQRCYFSAQIKALERDGTEDKNGRCEHVLVATSQDGGSLFAIERVRDGIYALCPLRGWISLEEFYGKPAKRVKVPAQTNGRRLEDGAPWWDRAAVTASVARSNSALDDQMPKPSISLSTAQHDQDDGTSLQEHEVGLGFTPSLTPNRPDEVSTPQKDDFQLTWEDIFTTLRSIYLEALYISKTSLAYFAKGPLSRARNTTSQLAPHETQPSSFLQILQGLTLTVPMSDKKYGKSLPELIREIPPGLSDADGDALKQMEVVFRRARRRKKISKGGFQPGEEEYACQWWLEKENSTEAVNLETTQSERIRSNLARQRTRETQLQIMIVLESMIAQNSMKTGEAKSPEVQQAQLTKADEALKKPQKPVDLQALLDIHADRLCIWQTTQDELIDESNKNSSQKASSGSLLGGKSNGLQDFCTEVLVPFYASRLPKVFAALCQKMGTIGATSPARPALRRVASTSQTQSHKPGAPLSCRSGGLKRVATEGNAIASRRSTPTLFRSATDSQSVRIKREPSELLFDDIPSHRPSITQEHRYSQREVDIAAISRATEAKLKRKAYLEQELASAIDVLKKPNSRLAVKELVDFADERATTSAASSKRKRPPMQTTPAQGVHVKATPRANRRKIVGLPGVIEPQNELQGVVGSSSEPRVPSSSQKSLRVAADLFRRPQARTAMVDATPLKNNKDPASLRHSVITVEQTPSRRGSRHENRLDPMVLLTEEDAEDELCLPSPVPTRPTPGKHGVSPVLAETPVKARTQLLTEQELGRMASTQLISAHGSRKVVPMNMQPPETGGMLQACESEGVPGQRSKTEISSRVQEEDEEEAEDVYKALGWDNDDDLL